MNRALNYYCDFGLLRCTFILYNQNKSLTQTFLSELPCYLLFCFLVQICRLACCSNEKVLLNQANIKNSHANMLNDYFYRSVVVIKWTQIKGVNQRYSVIKIMSIFVPWLSESQYWLILSRSKSNRKPNYICNFCLIQ